MTCSKSACGSTHIYKSLVRLGMHHDRHDLIAAHLGRILRIYPHRRSISFLGPALVIVGFLHPFKQFSTKMPPKTVHRTQCVSYGFATDRSSDNFENAVTGARNWPAY